VTSGLRFNHAYSECPVCIPARRSLMSGRRPASHGVTMNYDTWLEGPTLPGELTRAGYQTHLVGKLHLWPHRKMYGFMSEDWSDGMSHGGDYADWLRAQGVDGPGVDMPPGANVNSWLARPFHLDERLHFSHWCVDKALEFLQRRDPTTPFFLKVSFHQPHAPCTPPKVYWDRYINMDLGEPYVGEWARVFEEPPLGQPVCSWRTMLSPAQLKQFRAGYYGCVNQIDDEVGRLLARIPRNTVVVFTSDHGEMLGDHQWIRKRGALEPSARIPFLMRFPQGMGIPQERVCEAPVQLMDIMPTLLDAAGAPIPDTVEGASLLPHLRGQASWREYVHGECAEVPTLNSGMQYVTDGKRKFIWHPGAGTAGEDLFFDLEKDPREMENLAGAPERREEIAVWRKRLIEKLEGRPEGFVREGKLVPLSGPCPFCLPGFEKENYL
jgi:arylsulfatase A-like enzyme